MIIRWNLRRFLRITGLTVLAVTLLNAVVLAALLLFAHSAGGGTYIAQWTSALVNALDTGVRLEVASLGMEWPFKLKIRTVRLSDAQGLWLEAEQADAVLSPRSLLPNASLHWNIQAEQLVVRHVTWSRLPELPPDPPSSAPENSGIQPHPLTLLPENLRVSVDDLLLENIRIGASVLALQPAEPYILPFYDLRLKARGSISATAGIVDANAEIRPEQNAKIEPEQNAASKTEQNAPAAGESADNATAETPIPPPITRLNLNARFADNSLQVQTDLRDTLLLWPHLQAHLPARPAAQDNSLSPSSPLSEAPENLTVQGTLGAHIPSLTPSRDYPLRIHWDMRVTANSLLPATVQGTLLLNGEGLEWDKVSLAYPAAVPQAEKSPGMSMESAGVFDSHSGPVAQLELNMTDIAVLRDFGLSLPQISGPVRTSLHINATKQPFLQWSVHSPAMRVAQGILQENSFTLTAHTPEALPAAPATQALWSLPTSFKGNLAAEVQSCLGLGSAKFSTLWALDTDGHSPDVQLTNLQASMLGLNLNGKFASSGARITEAALNLAITDTKALARLANIPLQGCPLTFKAQLVPASPATPRMSNRDASVKGQLTFGAGSYNSVRWLSGEGAIEADTQQAKLNLTIKGPLAARLRCSYSFSKEILRLESVEVSESSLKIGAKLLNPTELCFAGGLRIDNANVSLRPAGNLHINGKLTPEVLDLDASVSDIPLRLAKAFTSAPLPHGIASAQARLKGSPASPTGTLSLRVDDIPLATKAGSPQASLLVDGTLSRSAATGRGATHSLNLIAKWANVDSLKDFDASARIPLRFAPVPTLAMDAPVQGKLFWQGEITPLWRLVPLPGRSLSGKGEVQALLSGSLRAPLFSGHAFVGRGKFVDSIDGILLDAITLEARYSEQGQSLLRLHATDARGGTLALDGSLSAVSSSPASSGPSAKGSQLALHGIINKLRPLRRDDVALQLSGTIDISGPVQAPLIAGNVCIDQGIVQLLDGFGGKNFKTLPVKDISDLRANNSAPKPPAPLPPPSAKPSAIAPAIPSANAPALAPDLPTGPHCDIRINAPGRLYIRGKGLDSEWKAQLAVTGLLSDPRILGSVTPIRGQLELMGHQFTLANGNITFSGSTPPNPALDLTLEYKSADITALIVLGGSAKQPKMRLSSQPVLPNDEIIAQILFGKNINNLSRFEALQAANTARQLVDFGPAALDILSSTRDVLGLEVLRLGSAEASRQNRAPRDASLQGTSSANPDDQAPTVQAGKYILDNVYVGLDQGTDANAGTAVRVEVELLPNLSLEGRTSNQSTGVGINWKMDY